MRLSDLRDAKVRTLDGKMLGRIHEVHADGGRVTALICGAASLIERMTAKKHGRRIPWDCVVRLGKSEVVVSLEAVNGMIARIEWRDDGSVSSSFIPIWFEPPGRPVLAGERAEAIAKYIERIGRDAALPSLSFRPDEDRYGIVDVRESITRRAPAAA